MFRELRIVSHVVRRFAVLCALTLLAAQPAATQKTDPPPIVWTCPMHPDVLDDHKGFCPICKMKLVQTRIEPIWSCPVHSVVEETHGGKCPICRRELVQVTTALSWTCADNPKIDRINPGKCADGSPMIPKHTPRAHGNHNPQHGGLFFMAPDNWHHLEGTYPEEGVFRLHLYDDYSKPLPLEKLKQVTGRVVTKNDAMYPLKLGNNGLFEARFDHVDMPAEMTAFVQLKREGPEHRFDFIFQEFSQDRGATILTAGISSALSIEIPDDTAQVLALLSTKSRQIRELIDKGSFGEIYVPAFHAKDLALALDVRAKELPLSRRAGAIAAIEQLVRSAWQLDAYGDLGNRDQINEAYASFAAAADEVESAFSKRPTDKRYK